MSSVVPIPSGAGSEAQDQVQKATPLNTSAKACETCSKSFVWFFPFSRKRSHCELCGRAACVGCLHEEPLACQQFYMCLSCRSTVLPRLRGLLAKPWFHGKIARQEAERRLRTETSALGDFLVRVLSDTENQPLPQNQRHHHRLHEQQHSSLKGEEPVLYVISVRDTPVSVSHIPIRGTEGDYFLDYSATYSTVDELVQQQMQTDLLDRAAIVEEHSLPTCPSCAVPVHAPLGDPSAPPSSPAEFCECGARVASSEDARRVYDTIGFDYLGHGTAA